ncbi:MAG TPA: universal stress protein [Gemmatimonadaceae bacterium]
MTSVYIAPANPAEAAPQQPLPPTTGPIIVATDGTEASDAAIVAARLLAASTNAPLQVVSAVEPITPPLFSTDAAPLLADVTTPRRAAQRDAIHQQLQRLVQPPGDCSVTMFDGEAAPVLAKAAHDRHARLLVLGRGRHGVMGRLLIGETVLRVLQLADVPVLAVEPGLAALPQRAMIAIDFSPCSIYAARVALSIIDPNATVYLVYVTPRLEQLAPAFEQLEEHDAQIQAAFAQLRRELGAEHMRIEPVTIRGHLGRALVDFASSKNVDLVASGTHGYGFFNRLILGSVATQLVRGAQCSVLAVPGSAAVRAAAHGEARPGRTRSLPRDAWPHELELFSRDNASRRCRLEVDDRDLGAQAVGTDLPLAGATYDHHAGEVQFVFGSSGRLGRSLSHVVPDVTAIDIQSDTDGRARALHVATERGSTLVTFAD